MTRIIHRHDTSTNWTSVNPTLSQGEFGVEDDTGKFKIGDGQTAWNSLAYASSGGGSTPENMVTTDTAQNITGVKNFTNGLKSKGYIKDTGLTELCYTDTNKNPHVGNVNRTLTIHTNPISKSKVIIDNGSGTSYDLIHSGNISEYSPVPNDYVVDKSDPSLMPSWYRVWNSGWCEQGGFISSVKNNALSSATITFLKPFKDTNYFVSLEEVKNNVKSNDSATGGHAVYTKQTDKMDIATYSWTNGRLWEAKGYIS